MTRRWSIEKTFDGRALTIERASLVSGMLAKVSPFVVLLVAAIVVAWHTPDPMHYFVPLIVVALALRPTLRWPARSAERIRIRDDGTVNASSAGADAHAAAHIRVAEDVTVRHVNATSGFALSRLLAVAHTPRVSIRSRGAEVLFGLALPDAEAQALVAELRAEGPLAADHAPDAETTAPVVDLNSERLRLEMRRLERAPVTPNLRWWKRSVPRLRTRPLSRPDAALALRRLGPLRRSAAWSEIGAIGVAGILVGYPAYRAIHGVATSAAIAATGLIVVFPAMVRLSQIAFAGALEAQVVGEPPRPGADVEIRLAQDRDGVVFEWLDLRLRCLHTIVDRRRGWSSEREIEIVTWEGLYRAPADRLPLGPDDAMRARFSLPPDAPPTDEKARPARRWRLEVQGMTPNGLYSESFAIVVVPARTEGG